MVSNYIYSNNGILVQNFTEIESSGKKNDRPQLAKALGYVQLTVTL